MIHVINCPDCDHQIKFSTNSKGIIEVKEVKCECHSIEEVLELVEEQAEVLLNKTMRRPNVYVVNQSGHDYSAAEKFGELVYLSRGSVNRYSVNEMYRRFASHIENSGPDDYLLLTSLTVMNVVAASMFAYKHGKINILLQKGKGYVERTLDLDQLLIEY